MKYIITNPTDVIVQIKAMDVATPKKTIAQLYKNA